MKKKNQFVELDIKYFTEKKPLVITKKIKKIEGDVNLMILPNVSFFVMKITNNYQTKYSIYSKENFEYNDKLDKINIMNENAIILYGYYMEIWVKNKSNIFIKNKTISIDITSNILINSKSSLLLYAEPDGILVWYIKENIPHKSFPRLQCTPRPCNKTSKNKYNNNKNVFPMSF
jgi:hypothetical protein